MNFSFYIKIFENVQHLVKWLRMPTVTNSDIQDEKLDDICQPLSDQKTSINNTDIRPTALAFLTIWIKLSYENIKHIFCLIENSY